LNCSSILDPVTKIQGKRTYDRFRQHCIHALIFSNAKVRDVMRSGDTKPGQPGSVLSVTFERDRQEFIGLNGGPMFKFSPAISFFVRCESQREVDRYWNRLLEGGTPQQCGWLTDKFGISCQIAPTALGELLQDKDTVKAGRVISAMMKMIKLDIAQLGNEYEGN
jgi:predicted 3-demethylubiquinone-9 3-methyltransferase (glyoxalase superfamily)